VDYVILIIGFLLLIKGADLFVEGASAIAKNFKVPSILIGLTIVAFGTSSPEAAVSIGAALKGANEIAFGNIVGSNIFNILFVMGVASFIYPLKVKRLTILKEFPFSLLTTITMFIISADILLQGSSQNLLSRADGLVLLCIFSIFVYYLVELALMSKESFDEEAKTMALPKSLLFSVIGLAGIIWGGNWVVSSSSSIGLKLGMSSSLVGLTIVSIGTSLPELVTSIVAALKGENDIAIGNIIGSNIFNILFILGVSAVINPLTIDSSLFFDIFYLLGATIIAFIFAYTNATSSKKEGIILTLSYIAYMAYIIIRN